MEDASRVFKVLLSTWDILGKQKSTKGKGHLGRCSLEEHEQNQLCNRPEIRGPIARSGAGSENPARIAAVQSSDPPRGSPRPIKDEVAARFLQLRWDLMPPTEGVMSIKHVSTDGKLNH